MKTDSSKPNSLELESLREELINQVFDHPSEHLRIQLFHNFFDKVLSTDNINIIESFLSEFIEDYLFSIKKYDSFGVDPFFTERIISQLKKLNNLSLVGNNLSIINAEAIRIEKQLEMLNSILCGIEYYEFNESKAFFPLIDKDSPEGFYGMIDSLIVRISKSSEANKFIIIPSEKEIESRITNQIQNSWIIALRLLKKYVRKPFKYHEVIISFNKKFGFYEGNSLGILLTLSFIEELLRFYNPQYVIKIKEQSAFTGGVSETGVILDTGEDIIKQKVAAIFYSDIQSFVIPKLEETYAFFALTQLKKKFPERNLKLIPVEDINDVLNRRDLVEIKKINPIVRTGKFFRRNWISASATIILAVLFAYLFVLDLDDNPFSIEADGIRVLVKNQRGKLLWQKNVGIPKSDLFSVAQLKRYVRIVDINEDGKNELIVCRINDDSSETDDTFASVYCYDFKGNKIWSYSFVDTAHSKREILPPVYAITMVDTMTIAGKKSLILISGNSQTFSSALFRIDLRAGERLPGTLWCSGFIVEGLLKDINNDGRKDFIGSGLDNGFEDAVFMAVEIDTLTKVRPTTEEYLIRGYPVAKMLSYIRFPKTDYDIYRKMRMPAIYYNTFIDNPAQKYFQFIVNSDYSQEAAALWYQVDYNLGDVNVIVDNNIRVIRDILVAKGVLQLPYTDTPEYVEKIKSKILYYKDGAWVTRNELE